MWRLVPTPPHDCRGSLRSARCGCPTARPASASSSVLGTPKHLRFALPYVLGLPLDPNHGSLVGIEGYVNIATVHPTLQELRIT